MDIPTNTTTDIPLIAKTLSSVAPQALLELLSQVSASVLLIWDIIITYDEEVKLVWGARRCVVNYLFFFIRYTTLSQVIVALMILLGNFKTKVDVCRLYVWFYAISTCLLISAVDILLAYRAFAFYGRDRRVLVGLVILWVLSSASVLVFALLISLEFPIFHSTTIFIPGILGECIVITSTPRFLHVIWISELIFQNLLFFIVLGRFIQLAITSWKTTGISTLYFIFIRDGIWAFFVLFGVFVAAAVQPQHAGLSLIQWAFVFVEITATRLILNLRSLNPARHSSASSYVISPSLKWAGKEVLFDTICEPRCLIGP